MSLAGSFTYAWARPSIPNARALAKTLLGTVELGYPIDRRIVCAWRRTNG